MLLNCTSMKCAIQLTNLTQGYTITMHLYFDNGIRLIYLNYYISLIIFYIKSNLQIRFILYGSNMIIYRVKSIVLLYLKYNPFM